MGGENKRGVEGRRHHQSLRLPHLVLQHFQAAACHPRTQAAPAPMDGSWHTQNSTAEHGMAPYGLGAKHPHPVPQGIAQTKGPGDLCTLGSSHFYCSTSIILLSTSA